MGQRHATGPQPRRGARSLASGPRPCGRGGPAACALSPSPDFRWLFHVRDSKQLDAAKREELAAYIWRDAFAVGVGFVSHTAVDRIGIAEATGQAMLRAIGEGRRRARRPA